MQNAVPAFYDNYSYEEISNSIADIIRGESLDTPLEVIFQTVEDLNIACPKT